MEPAKNGCDGTRCTPKLNVWMTLRSKMHTHRHAQTSIARVVYRMRQSRQACKSAAVGGGKNKLKNTPYVCAIQSGHLSKDSCGALNSYLCQFINKPRTSQLGKPLNNESKGARVRPHPLEAITKLLLSGRFSNILGFENFPMCIPPHPGPFRGQYHMSSKGASTQLAL
jgi:hypothetical protein